MAPVPSARCSFLSPGLAAAYLVVAVALAYGFSLRAPFLFDDAGAVVDNPTIRRLWSLDVLRPPADGSTTTGRPVVNLSFALNHALSGGHVWSYHALNVVIHALAGLVLMGILRRTLTGAVLRERFAAAAPGLAFVIALFWALHPLQTESVVSIAQRTETLCGLFYLLTLYAFIRGTGPGAPSRRWLGLAVASCLLGMGTKEVMVTAPVMVLLYDRTFVAGSFAAAWRGHGRWHAALASTWLLLAGLLLHGGGARGASAGFGLGMSTWSYLLTQCEAILLYLRLSLWPSPLVLDYGTTVVQSVAEVGWEGTVVLALLVGVVWALVRKPALGFAGAWFFLILSPSSSVVPLVTQTMAEHRMYLPLAAVVVLGVLGLHSRIGGRVAWLAGALAVAYGGVTAIRNREYRDALVLWTANVSRYPQSARAHNNLALILHEQGKTAEAGTHFARAVQHQPGYVSAHYNWGVALLDQQRVAEAIVQFETALRGAPDHSDARVNLGNALARLGRGAEALPHYEAALRLKPGPDVHFNLGLTLASLGRDEEAVNHLRTALQGRPDLAEAHYRLGRLAERAGDGTGAEKHYSEASRIAPGHSAAHASLGVLLARSGRLAAAREHLRTAVQLNPGDADALANLGNVLLVQGEGREALARYEEAQRLRPDDARLRESVRLAREALGGSR